MEDRYIVFETDHWKVILREDDQRYLGRCVVVLKREAGALTVLTDAEWLDFAGVVKKLETLVRETFGAVLFNWGCLMNNAFQEKPYDPQVHWHVRPRYDKPVEIAGETFEDPNFGHHYLRGAGEYRSVSTETAGAILTELKKNLK